MLSVSVKRIPHWGLCILCLVATVCVNPAKATAQVAVQGSIDAPVVPPRTGKSEVIRFKPASLAEWEGSPEFWKVHKNEYIAGSTGPMRSTFLLTKTKFSDVRITLWSRVTESTNHAGVSLWGERNPAGTNPWAYKGLLVIFPGLALWDYFEGKGIPTDEAGRDLAKQVTSQNEWIHVEILAVGNRIRAAYNGRAVLDWREPNPARLMEGPIGLQLHSWTRPQQVIYKDVVIETFPKEDRLLTVKR